MKSVSFSLFKPFCTKVFTLMSAYAAERQCDAWRRNSKSSGIETTKTGGSDPTFSAFSRPKSAWGSLPPLVRTEDAEKNHRRAERGGLSFRN